MGNWCSVRCENSGERSIPQIRSQESGTRGQGVRGDRRLPTPDFFLLTPVFCFLTSAPWFLTPGPPCARMSHFGVPGPDTLSPMGMPPGQPLKRVGAPLRFGGRDSRLPQPVPRSGREPAGCPIGGPKIYRRTQTSRDKKVQLTNLPEFGIRIAEVSKAHPEAGPGAGRSDSHG